MPSDITTMYSSDEYIRKHPDMFAPDSPWKVERVWPYMEHAVRGLNKPVITLLDVGGGAGEILRLSSEKITGALGTQVKKYILDLSPGILEMQRATNPDIIRSLNEDIAHTSLADKEIDLALLLDVLEHVTEPMAALREIRRISHWALFKVPLEDNLYFNLLNWKTRGQFRHNLIDTLGHINVYNFATLRQQVEANAGSITTSGYTGAYTQFLHSPAYHLTPFHRLVNQVAAWLYPLFPAWCARVFNDFAILLVNCDAPVADPTQ